MKPLIILKLALTLTLATVLVGYAQENAGEHFQSGLYKEEVGGDLEGAIEIYRKIIKEFPQNRPLAAKALLHIGLCYEKMGLVEAQKAYRRLLEEFADQYEVVTEARERLSALEHLSRETSGMVVHPVWAPAEDVSGMPAPDGRYLTYADWTTANLAVRDLTTGESRLLTDEGTWMEPDQWAYVSVWSPDGQQIAYVWFNKDVYELRLVGLDGSRPRVLYRSEGGQYVQPYAWSRDGRYILTWFGRMRGANEIGLVSVADGSTRVLKAGVRRPIQMSLSPDDRFVVYDQFSREGSSGDNIFLLPTDGGAEVPLVMHPANDYGPVWMPDGRHILFVSDRTGTPTAWSLEVIDGKRQGEPRLIKLNMERKMPMGFTQEGSFYYALMTPTADYSLGDVLIATLDPETGRVTAPPAKAPQRFEGLNAWPNWSPDGKQLAYVSQRGLWPGRAGFCALVIRNVESGEEREWPLNHMGKIRWSPDGRSILVIGRSLRLIDVQTGENTPVVRARPGISITQAEFSPDGKEIFYLRQRRTETEYIWSIVVRNLETEEEKELLSQGIERGFDLSPDGRQLVFTDEQVLSVIPAAGGEPRELLRLQPSETTPNGPGPIWTPDGRHIIVGKGKRLYPDDPEASERQLFEMWQVPVAGGEPQNLGFAMEAFHGLSVHPDGRRVAFTQSGSARHNEVWVMENFVRDPGEGE